MSMDNKERELVEKILQSYEGILEYLRLASGRIDYAQKSINLQHNIIVELASLIGAMGDCDTKHLDNALSAYNDNFEKGSLIWPTLPGDDEYGPGDDEQTDGDL